MTREEQAQYIYEKLMENREFRKAFAGAIIDAVIEVVTVIQSLQQEHCGDAISRQAVLDLIEHYNSDGLGSVFYGYEQGVKFADAINKLPPVTPKQIEYKDGGDFQYYIDTLADAITFKFSDGTIKTARLGKLKEQLIKQAKRRTGHWRHYEGMLICSECGAEYYDGIMEYCGDDVPKYCPMCGSRMMQEGKECQ